MTIATTIQTIERLKKELDALRPLKPEDEARLWKKFRLEWNYNSNHIEGNTLTYGETELLLIFGKTTGDHTIREYEEMKAHDVAISQLREYAVDEEDRFNEGFIRELNKTILKEPYYKPAETLEGRQTQKQIIPGEYKTTLNSVRLQNGEMFHYASPEETPAKMGDLVQWYRNTLASAELHPAQIAAELHYRFVLIHPFDDGNGRVARLLMNYVLMRAGYPPVIIPTKDKKAYLDALNKVDTNVDTQAFAGYIAKQLVWSLELNLKAAKGEDIEEEDDLDKEISIWKKEFDFIPNVQHVNDNLRKLYSEVISTLFGSILERYRVFDDLFLRVEIQFHVDFVVLRSPEELNAWFDHYVYGGNHTLRTLELHVDFINFVKKIDKPPFNIRASLMIILGKQTFSIVSNEKQLYSDIYDKRLSQEKIKEISKESVQYVWDMMRKSASLDT
ncbi:hypothetical protein BH09BAC1_BH09BAC1_20730 [soil metagenome]